MWRQKVSPKAIWLFHNADAFMASLDKLATIQGVTATGNTGSIITTKPPATTGKPGALDFNVTTTQRTNG